MSGKQKKQNNPLIAVVDTNVIISSLWNGLPGKIMKSWENGLFKIAISNEILNEYIDILKRFQITDEDLDEFILLFANTEKTIIAKPNKHINVITDDPADNKFLECAVASNADYIISGDRHLLRIKKYANIPIIRPKEFIKIIV